MLTLKDGDSHVTDIVVISFSAHLTVSGASQELGKQFDYSCEFNKNKTLLNSTQVDLNEERACLPVYLVARLLLLEVDMEVLAAAF